MKSGEDDRTEGPRISTRLDFEIDSRLWKISPNDIVTGSLDMELGHAAAEFVDILSML
jgi:hypothetical protein